ncbi:hypothetical protein E2C01_100034 [Portunus trituberculatus]|uniref:Uncharacterized protein n=1 Tax=Portunus trituberculatus TaxID=210409 RepID=A0A5B7K700_PORTR|nr:hypothetical protein [Portunus trituberculatus]
MCRRIKSKECLRYRIGRTSPPALPRLTASLIHSLDIDVMSGLAALYSRATPSDVFPVEY